MGKKPGLSSRAHPGLLPSWEPQRVLQDALDPAAGKEDSRFRAGVCDHAHSSICLLYSQTEPCQDTEHPPSTKAASSCAHVSSPGDPKPSRDRKNLVLGLGCFFLSAPAFCS